MHLPTNDWANTPLTMSSLEIAQLVEKRHDHVMRDIKKMLDELGLPAPRFGGEYMVQQPNGGEREAPCFDLPKDLTLTLVAGYNVVLRKRIIDRWMELEEFGQLPNFRHPQTAARAWSDQYDRADAAERKNEELQATIDELMQSRTLNIHLNISAEDFEKFDKINIHGPSQTSIVPRAAKTAKRKMTANDTSEHLDRFLSEMCEVNGDPKLFTFTRDLVAAFHKWRDVNCLAPLPDRSITLALRALSLEWTHPVTGKRFGAIRRSAIGYCGIKLLETKA